MPLESTSAIAAPPAEGLPSGPRLHVGIDATTWSNDRGFGRFTRELLLALIARDSGIRYTLVFDQAPSDPLPEGVEAIHASTEESLNEASQGTNSRSLGYLWRMGRLAREGNFDVFFFPAVYSYFPLLSRVPCVVCYHDTTAERLPGMLFPSKLNHRLWQAKTFLAKLQTTRAMTVSMASARDLHTILRFPEDQIDVVTEAADPMFRQLDDAQASAQTRAAHGIPEDAELLVHIGGMNRHKNILRLLQAMPAVVSRNPRTHLAIVGNIAGTGFWDNVPELQAFVANHPPLDQHVHFTGRLEDDVLVQLLNGAAALVFPSLWEGFGLPAVEAMACGVPVLASDRGSLPEVVGDAGILFDPEKVEAISSTILAFLGDPALRARLAEAAPRRARSFNWDRAAELAEVSFRRCAGERRSMYPIF